VIVTDRLSKLAEESVDVAVRIGPLHEKALIARKLRSTRLITVAAPSYVARRGLPRTAVDLDSHDCLVLQGPHGKPHAWVLKTGPRPVTGMVVVDHGPTLTHLVLAGLGITQLFDHMAEQHLRSGALVPVLEREVTSGPDIHAVCAPGRRAAARVRAAFDAFADAFSAAREAQPPY
jgi:DNA-binding transcriptional LysR family regulator